MKNKCWSCSKESSKPEFFCIHCGKIQEGVEVNEFELFGMKESILISIDKLEESYLRLQSKFHPDKYINLSEKEREISTIYSSKVNEIYEKLRNNVSRINLILKLSDFEDYDEGKSFDDPETLNEIMEIQEEFMFTDNLEIKQKIKDKVNKMIKETITDIEKYFENNEYEKISKNNIKLSYLEKILEK